MTSGEPGWSAQRERVPHLLALVSVETGTGRIDRIYVLVPDDEGVSQVAVGGVYSYYEFLQPAAERLTDEAWRAMLDEGDAPERPAWEAAFLAGG